MVGKHAIVPAIRFDLLVTFSFVCLVVDPPELRVDVARCVGLLVPSSPVAVVSVADDRLQLGSDVISALRAVHVDAALDDERRENLSEIESCLHILFSVDHLNLLFLIGLSIESLSRTLPSFHFRLDFRASCADRSDLRHPS